MYEVENWCDIPYPKSLLKEVSDIRYKNEIFEFTLNDGIRMADLITGMATGSNHYVLMEDSVEIFEVMMKYDIETLNHSLEEFKERKKNTEYKHRIGLIDTTLQTMEVFYYPKSMRKLFKKTF